MMLALFVAALAVILGFAGWIAVSLFQPDDNVFDGFGDDADFEEDDRFFLTDKGWDE